MRKRRTAQVLLDELREAYADIDRVPYEDDPDRCSQAIGRYDGLKRAYVLLTGRGEQEVSMRVVTWYVQTTEYQQAKAQHGTRRG